MSHQEDLLQQRLEALEAGQPLDSCLTGLSEAEAEMLKLVAYLRELPFPTQTPHTVATQRAHLINMGAKETNMTEQPGEHILNRLRALFDGLLMRRELAAGLALVAIAALVIFTWMGISRISAPEANKEILVAVPRNSQDSTTVAAPEPTAAATQTTAQTTESEGAAPTASEEVAVSPGQQIYLPLFSKPLVLNAQTAVIQNINGVAEIQQSDGTWTVVTSMGTVGAGQRVRTGELSSATILFYDGSQASLGAESEISIDQLDAQKPEDGFRTVVVTQWLGESEHQVAFRNDGGSRYEVNTPAGSGIARGTKFQVIVTPNLLAHFIVSEGKVDVSNLNKVVSITAGQLSILAATSTPGDPFFSISGQGTVSQIGSTWIIAGQTFQTDGNTIIVGNPQVGDLVRVQGHLLADGSRVADRIVLLQQAPTNRFTLTGAVETMGATAWTVAGQAIVVNATTLIDENIVVGDEVRVEGIIAPGGTLIAQQITLAQVPEGFPFHFAGVVQSVNADTWVISGQTIHLDENSQIIGNPDVGDVVAVNGRILNDSIWLAHTIRLLESQAPDFAFTGIVNSIDPWIVAGIGFSTEPWTVIEPNINVGDRVRVRGTILADGTWVATSIQLLDTPNSQIISIVGTVASINPWVINGLPLIVDSSTVIIGNITVGTLVQARIELLPDGTWHVISIRPIFTAFGLGCFQISTAVVSLAGSQLSLKHWPTIQLGNNAHIQGNIKANSVILLPLCFWFDGTVIISGDIIVIYQPVVVIINNGGGNSGGSRKGSKDS